MIEINKSKFNAFINNNLNLSECQKKLFIFLNNKRGGSSTFYVGKTSNKQIRTLYNAIITNNNYEYEAKLKNLFANFIIPTEVNTLMNVISMRKNITDLDVINLMQRMKKNIKASSTGVSGSALTNSWQCIAENISKNVLEIMMSINSSKHDNLKYLDYSCGSCYKSKMFAKCLNIEPKNAYGTDINHWGHYNHSKKPTHINFELIDQETGTTPFNDNQFDIITCILSLHHIEELDVTLAEIRRIIRPDGLFIIIETDVNDEYALMINDIMHFIYAYLYDGNKGYLKNPDYAKYYNWIEWDYILSLYGFSYIKGNFIFTKIEDLRYDRYYYSIYRTIK